MIKDNWYEDQVIGEEDAMGIEIIYRDGLTSELIEAALRKSPPSAALAHLQRLAMHKRLGSNDSERAILLHDYAEALRPYSDFTIFTACKAIWENTATPFYPKISEIAGVCEIIHESFSRIRSNMLLCISAEKRNKYYEKPQDNPLRRTLCDFLIGKDFPEYFEKTKLYSNYQLEVLARGKGWGRDEQKTEPDQPTE